MIGKIATFLARFALDRANLSLHDRMLLTNCILDNIAALPLRDIISINEEGTLLVNGRPIDLEKAKQLRESARGALSSIALNMIYDQVGISAAKYALEKSTRTEDIFFAKAARWWGEQEFYFLKLMAQMDDQEREIAP